MHPAAPRRELPALARTHVGHIGILGVDKDGAFVVRELVSI